MAFPALMTGGRPFDPARAAEVFDERRVRRYLSEHVWRRRVDKGGRIAVYNRAMAGGRGHAGEDVLLTFDAAAVAWVVRDERGTELARHPAAELRRDRILALDVSHKR